MPELRVTIPTRESAPEKIDYFTPLEHRRAAYGRLFLQSLTAHTHRERARSHFGTRWPGEPLVTASTGALVATTNPHTLMRPSYTPQGKDNKKSHRGFFFSFFSFLGIYDQVRNRRRRRRPPEPDTDDGVATSDGRGVHTRFEGAGRSKISQFRPTHTDRRRPTSKTGRKFAKYVVRETWTDRPLTGAGALMVYTLLSFGSSGQGDRIRGDDLRCSLRKT